MPAAVIGHIAAAAGLAGSTGELAGYDNTSYRTRLSALVRGYVGIAGYDRETHDMAMEACLEAARTRDDLADIVNAGIASALPLEVHSRLTALLAVSPGAARSGWDQAKADPPRSSPQRMREHLAHLAWLRGQAVADDVFAGVPDRKLCQFAAEARALNAAVLSHVTQSKRLALMAALLSVSAAAT